MDENWFKYALLLALVMSFIALLIGIINSVVSDKPFSWLSNVPLFLFLLLFWFIIRTKKKNSVS
jgi:hypothetical protein